MKAWICFSFLILSVPALAEDRVDQREENQQERIENGVKDGSLTEHEAKKLENQQERIEKRKEKMEADGKLSPREKRRLERMQDRASHSIARKKHNARGAH